MAHFGSVRGYGGRSPALDLGQGVRDGARPTKHYGKWRIRWTDENGQRKSEVFDDRREAAFQLQQRELEAEERRRGLKAALLAPKAFADLADYWEKNRVPQKRSGHHDESILRRHLRPSFGQVTLGNPAIWIELVDKYVVDRAHLNKKTVANHLTLLVTMLNVAVDLGWLTKVPRIRKPRVRLFQEVLHRVLDRAEFPRIGRNGKNRRYIHFHDLETCSICRRSSATRPCR